MVTAAMKLRDTCSLEEKLWPTFSSVQFTQSYPTLCDPMNHSTPPCPSPTPGVHPNPCPLSWWCHPTISSSVVPFSSCPQSIPSIRGFSNKQDLHIRWPNYWSFRFSISPSNEYSRLISFRIDWFDLPTLKCLLQHHSSKASILWCSAFFIVQLSYPYITTGKNIALTRWTFAGKVMSLLFNMLSRLVIASLLRSKYLLILWLQSSSSVTKEPKKIKSITIFTFYPPEVMGPDTLVLVFQMLSFKPAFSLFSFNLIKRLFSSSSLSSIRVVSSTYLRLFIFLPATLISACDASSPAQRTLQISSISRVTIYSLDVLLSQF